MNRRLMFPSIIVLALSGCFSRDTERIEGQIATDRVINTLPRATGAVFISGGEFLEGRPLQQISASAPRPAVAGESDGRCWDISCGGAPCAGPAYVKDVAPDGRVLLIAGGALWIADTPSSGQLRRVGESATVMSGAFANSGPSLAYLESAGGGAHLVTATFEGVETSRIDLGDAAPFSFNYFLSYSPDDQWIAVSPKFVVEFQTGVIVPFPNESRGGFISNDRLIAGSDLFGERFADRPFITRLLSLNRSAKTMTLLRDDVLGEGLLDVAPARGAAVVVLPPDLLFAVPYHAVVINADGEPIEYLGFGVYDGFWASDLTSSQALPPQSANRSSSLCD
ncbi:MAG: hypothetical protein SF069_06925 [Phycisphaerae bacterium]|nr:hypothetical protein [Phycisphaerae bacterium]